MICFKGFVQGDFQGNFPRAFVNGFSSLFLFEGFVQFIFQRNLSRFLKVDMRKQNQCVFQLRFLFFKGLFQCFFEGFPSFLYIYIYIYIFFFFFFYIGPI